MDFETLVKLYDNISSTRKRLEILDITSVFFKQVKNDIISSEDLEKIIYLTQGVLFPEIQAQPKIGLGDKSLLDFLSKYYSVNSAKAKQILKETGDLGDTAEKIAGKSKGKKSQITSFFEVQEDNLSITDIYEKLEEISQVSGSKSVDKKYGKLKWLLARCSPKAAKYLLRIITGTLRVGISDPTIMDALAVAYLNNKEMRKDIERAYNIHPDLGYIARVLDDQGIKGITNVSIQVGMPIRMMLASRLEYTKIFEKFGSKKFVSEFKLDGERLQIHKNENEVKIFSRQLKNITDQYPDVIQTILENIDAKKVILEGEVVALDEFDEMLPFQVLITRKRKYNIEETVEKVRVCLYIFEVLYLEKNKSAEITMDYDLLKRRKILKEIVKQTDNLKVMTGKFIHSTDELIDYFNEARSKGTEGLMNKSIDPETSVYKAGNRGFSWIKLKSLDAGKLTDNIDVVVIGANWGKGRRVNRYGAFLVAVRNSENDRFEMLTRVASGFSDEDLEQFSLIFEKKQLTNKPESIVCTEKADVWFKPEIVIEISGDELTISPKADAGKQQKGNDSESGYSVRFPVFQRIRDDKGINESTTVDEIIELYESQGS